MRFLRNIITHTHYVQSLSYTIYYVLLKILAECQLLELPELLPLATIPGAEPAMMSEMVIPDNPLFMNTLTCITPGCPLYTDIVKVWTSLKYLLLMLFKARKNVNSAPLLRLWMVLT